MLDKLYQPNDNKYKIDDQDRPHLRPREILPFDVRAVNELVHHDKKPKRDDCKPVEISSNKSECVSPSFFGKPVVSVRNIR